MALRRRVRQCMYCACPELEHEQCRMLKNENYIGLSPLLTSDTTIAARAACCMLRDGQALGRLG
jgi:hypothetical protein